MCTRDMILEKLFWFQMQSIKSQQEVETEGGIRGERVCHFDPRKIPSAGDEPGVFVLKMDKIGLKMDQKELNIVLLYQKYIFA